MKLIEWNDKLSVKINSIDDEHKVLIDMINEFYDKIKSKEPVDLILILIAKMKNYTVVHFTTEENYFKKYDYPGYDKHKKEHDTFVNKVIDLEKRVSEGKMIVSFEITSFLKKWLTQHIQGTDQEYIDFLISKGVR